MKFSMPPFSSFAPAVMTLSFEQSTGQPLHLIGSGLRLVRLCLAELQRICLRSRDTAIEIDVVSRGPIGAGSDFLHFSLDLNRGRRPIIQLQKLRLSVSRH